MFRCLPPGQVAVTLNIGCNAQYVNTKHGAPRENSYSMGGTANGRMAYPYLYLII